MALISGVGPDAETVVNEHGAKQSKAASRLDLIDGRAILHLGRVLAYGLERYPDKDNWRRIPMDDHLNHVLVHIYAHLAGDTQDDHLGHAFCRMLFALGVHLEAPPDNKETT